MIEIVINNEDIFQKDLSKNQNISLKYLAQIIASLKSSGFITTVAGNKSGYILTKHPSTIQIYDIYRAFNPDVKIASCLDGKGNYKKDSQCAIKEFWAGMNNQIKEYIQSKYLNELSEKPAKIKHEQQDLMFHI
ncbi:MAG: Rrf2 family transcriptional regulator [Deltaproteobacteria bacterium]|nr:Rrf2 family transcriptional regulator [Deltaproteobacteria bacterium]